MSLLLNEHTQNCMYCDGLSSQNYYKWLQFGVAYLVGIYFYWISWLLTFLSIYSILWLHSLYTSCLFLNSFVLAFVSNLLQPLVFLLLFSLSTNCLIIAARVCCFMADLPPLQGVPVLGIFAPPRQGQPFVARQGPVMKVNHAYFNCLREDFSNKLIARMVDDKPLPPYRLQYVIQANWKLQGNIYVRSKYRQYYVLEFENVDDLEYVLANGPWVVQKRLFVVQRWVPNTSMRSLRIDIVDLWFRFSGVLMELINYSMGWKLGDLLGEPLTVDISDETPFNMERIRVRIRVDITKPIPMGVFVPLSDESMKWISCVPKRVFRLCVRCGVIGHLKEDCTKSPQCILAALEEQRLKVMHTMQVDFAVAPDAPQFFCPPRKSEEAHYRRTSKLFRKFNHAGWIYANRDLVRRHQPLNEVNADFSSSDSEDNDNEGNRDELPGADMEIDHQNNIHLADEVQNITEQVQQAVVAQPIQTEVVDSQSGHSAHSLSLQTGNPQQMPPPSSNGWLVEGSAENEGPPAQQQNDPVPATVLDTVPVTASTSRLPQIQESGGVILQQPPLFAFNGHLPQVDGGFDDYWEGIINDGNDADMESSEDLSDINPADVSTTPLYDYSFEDPVWPQMENIPLTDQEVNQIVDSSILYASSVIYDMEVDFNCFIKRRQQPTWEDKSLFGSVFLSQDIMDLFLFQDVDNIAKWAKLWPNIMRTCDGILSRWASKIDYHLDVEEHGSSTLGRHHWAHLRLLIFNINDGPLQVDLMDLFLLKSKPLIGMRTYGPPNLMLWP